MSISCKEKCVMEEGAIFYVVMRKSIIVLFAVFIKEKQKTGFVDNQDCILLDKFTLRINVT